MLGTQVVSKAGATENGRWRPQREGGNVRGKLLLLSVMPGAMMVETT